MRKVFVYQDAKSNKFWTIDVEGKILTVIFGKANTAGRTNVKEFSTAEEAEKGAIKLIKEKIGKGYREGSDIEPNASSIGVAEFWNLIERAKKKAFGDIDEQIEILTEILSERPVEDIIGFGRILDYYCALSYTSDLWAAAYIIQGGCSDDAFDYFRAWLIAQGREVFENAMGNPESLAKIISIENAEEIEAESFLYAAQDAYQRKTGGGFDEFIDRQGVVNLPEIDLDWEEGDDSLKKKFPKLYEKFSN